MSHFILGNADLPQAVDVEAVASVQMRKNRGVFQLVFFSATGAMLGLYAVPKVSDAGVGFPSDADYKQVADAEFRKVLGILNVQKPKTRQEIHNFAGFAVEIPEPVVEGESPVSEDAPTQPTEES